MEQQDIRWKQRFSHYRKALMQFNNAVSIAEERELTDLEQQGLIQSFEYTHELAWNVLRDYLRYQGQQQIHGIRDAVRLAFNTGLLENGDIWMDMIRDRNQTSHAYNQEAAAAIAERILNFYAEEFSKFEQTFEKIELHTYKS